MRIKRLVLVVVFLLLPQISLAAIYRCIINDETIFSQVPCADDAELLNVKSHNPNSASAGNAGAGDSVERNSSSGDKPSFAERKKSEREIKTLEKKRKKLFSRRDKELEKINDKIRGSSNRSKVSKLQMKAMDVQGNYNQQIADISKRISKLRAGK